MDLGAVLIALFTGLVVKVAVMVYGVRLLLKLYRASFPESPSRLWLLLPKEDLPEIRLLWCSLVLFCISEFTCGIEVYVLMQCSPVLTGIHGVVSGVGMGLFAMGLYLFANRHLIRYGTPGCLANRLCHGCTVDQVAGCKYRVVLLFIATFVALAAIGPMFASTEGMAADMRRWMLPVPELNAWYDRNVIPWLAATFPGHENTGLAYYLPGSMMVLEFRILPAISLLLALVAIGCLMRRRETAGMKLLAFSAGLLCYSYFELVLYRGTGDVFIGSLGHELGELWFVLITAEFLRRTFPPERRRPEAAVAGVAAV